MAGQADWLIDVIVASDGEASHPHSPTHTRAELAALRRVEALNAVADLAAAAVPTFLGIPDGQLTEAGDCLVEALLSVVSASAWLACPWLDDGHPDHQACGRAARQVSSQLPGIRLFEFPIWAWHWLDPESTDSLTGMNLWRLDMSTEARRIKTRALECYPSQRLPLSSLPGDESILSDSTTAYFARHFEIFCKT